jgi:hypothetical protein
MFISLIPRPLPRDKKSLHFKSLNFMEHAIQCLHVSYATGVICVGFVEI